MRDLVIGRRLLFGNVSIRAWGEKLCCRRWPSFSVARSAETFAMYFSRRRCLATSKIVATNPFVTECGSSRKLPARHGVT